MKFINKKLKSGFGILEMLLSSSIFVLLLMSVVGLLLFSRDSLQKDNLSSRASLIANEGLSAVESIRDRNFSNLVDGVYGLKFENNQWIFFEDSDSISDFTRRVTISSISAEQKKVSVEVNWFKSFSRLGRVLLTRYFTDWSKIEDDIIDDDSWWNNNWPCRQKITIDNSNSALVLNDYQVLLNINTQDLISQEKMNIDCSDMRFLDSDQETILNYWIEANTCNSNNTKVWLKVPFIPSFNLKNVYLYYNNSEASSFSSIENTFIREINTNNPLVLDLPINEGGGLVANDYSGLNNFADINGATWTNGLFDSALEFNGVNSYLGIANSASLNPEHISLAAWVKWNIDPESGANWASIINKNVDSQYRLHHNRLNTAFEFAIRTANGGRWVVSETIPQEGVWYFLVGTYDGSELKIYVNGNLEGIASHSGSINTSNVWLAIGRRTSNDRYFEGDIDKVQIYNRALSEAEVIDLYNNYGQAVLNYPGKTLVRKHYKENLEFNYHEEVCLDLELDFDYQVDIYDDWGTGYCANVVISTDSEEEVVWELDLVLDTFPLNGIVYTVWEADWTFNEPILSLSGLSYNDTVSLDNPVTVGFCANREEDDDDGIPIQEADYEIVIDSQWVTGYCATILVTTTSNDLIEWFVEIEITGTPSSVWEADWTFNEPILSASGLSYNKYISSSDGTSFGFCANLPPPQANFLIIETNNASTGGFQNRTVSDIYLSNNSSSIIEIESIEVAWTGNPPSRLREVFINNTSIWSGNTASSEITIFDNSYILNPGNDPYNLSLRFQHNFSGRTINYIIFNLSDGSSKTVENINL